MGILLAHLGTTRDRGEDQMTDTVTAPSSSSQREVRTSTRFLQIALGVIWLLDGVLQFQPYMFTKDFVKDILIGSAQGNPGFIYQPTIFIAHFVEPHIVVWNALFATVQTAIGLGILAGVFFRRVWILKAALVGSIAWSVLVWWLSEGMGGIFTGASPLVGAPGAVILYLVIAIILWPSNENLIPQELEQRSPRLASLPTRAVWLGLWALCAFLLLEPPNQGRGSVSTTISQAASGEPRVLHGLLTTAAKGLNGAGPWVDSLLAVVMLLVGLGGFFMVYPKVFLIVSMVLGIGIWIFSEALGGILTGQGTDPNSGPLWVLLACCLWVGFDLIPKGTLLHRRINLTHRAMP